MSIISLHLIRNFIPPFLFGLSVTTFILMIEVLQRYFNLFLEKGIDFRLATEVLLLSLGHTFALSIPMAVLVGVLMGVGQLASDQEITAMKASGISLYRIAQPLLLIGVLLTGSMMAYNHWILPESNHRLRSQLIEIHNQRPMLEIHPNQLTDISEKYTIFVQGKDDRTGMLQDVKLYQREGRGDPSPDTIVARSGRIKSVAAGRIQLDLFDGEFHRIPDTDDPDTYNRTRFARQTVHISLGAADGSARPHARGEREMNVTLLRESIADQEALKEEARRDGVGILHRALDDALADLGVREDEDASERTQLRSALEEYRSLNNRIDRNAKALATKATLLDNHRIRANRFRVELHKKFSIPVACTVFVLLGVPMAIAGGRGGKGVSMGMSIASFVVYYLFLTGGEKLADRGLLSPWLSMWAANMVLGSLGIFLLRKTVRETRTFQIRLPWRKRLAETT